MILCTMNNKHTNDKGIPEGSPQFCIISRVSLCRHVQSNDMCSGVIMITIIMYAEGGGLITIIMYAEGGGHHVC